jgi:hypothetical protein
MGIALIRETLHLTDCGAAPCVSDQEALSRTVSNVGRASRDGRSRTEGEWLAWMHSEHHSL